MLCYSAPSSLTASARSMASRCADEINHSSQRLQPNHASNSLHKPSTLVCAQTHDRAVPFLCHPSSRPWLCAGSAAIMTASRKQDASSPRSTHLHAVHTKTSPPLAVPLISTMQAPQMALQRLESGSMTNCCGNPLQHACV
jgi:hypothetical protein